MALVFGVVWSAAHAHAQCDPATEYTYTMRNTCAEPVWIGQRSVKDPKAYPPQSGNWALAGMCASNTHCPSGACDADSGLCVCSSSADCPGSAPCGADDKCVNVATFCLPQTWNSGTFWPRTGCTLDESASPATLTCATGACFATDNSGKQLLDCSAENGGGSPNNPVTQFEVTSKSSSVNYDVSLAAGYNVETSAVPRGGGQVVPGTPSTDVVGCEIAGCTADLNPTCPVALQVVEDSVVVGCLDPCTRCQRPDPPASLACDTEVPETTWTCGVASGPVKNVDLYCAKNTVDGTAQASPNQGVPTAFSQLDCAPGTTFVTPTFASSYSLPAGQGICVYSNPPQSTIPHFNENGWADAESGTTKNCGGLPPTYTPLPDGTPCGGYLTKQSDGGYYAGALGYTCQTATYPVNTDAGSAQQVSHLCMPPTESGLGTCRTDTLGGLPLYTGGAGVTNQAWLDAAKVAGDGTPYFVPFKTACRSAYAWQYDDLASGFGCTPSLAAAGDTTFSGFDVTFCASRPGPGLGHGSGLRSTRGLTVRGRAARLDRPRRGLVRLKGVMSLPTTVALEDATVVVTDLLDEVGGAGELIAATDATWPLTPSPRKRKKKVAVFETGGGGEPRLRVVLHRPNPRKERVRVVVVARRATIARPTACADSDTAALETALLIGDGATQMRAGTIGPWRCRREVLRAK